MLLWSGIDGGAVWRNLEKGGDDLPGMYWNRVISREGMGLGI